MCLDLLAYHSEMSWGIQFEGYCSGWHFPKIRRLEQPELQKQVQLELASLHFKLKEGSHQQVLLNVSTPAVGQLALVTASRQIRSQQERTNSLTVGRQEIKMAGCTCRESCQLPGRPINWRPHAPVISPVISSDYGINWFSLALVGSQGGTPRDETVAQAKERFRVFRGLWPSSNVYIAPMSTDKIFSNLPNWICNH